SVNTQILRLRRKLETDPAKPSYIRTERGAGYLFGAAVDIVY
ncbi:MAG TPA: winged helix-turn-helix domain-containing protein, partial [Albitalea sp.]|nr:winged helix-turn-helix domain-containing protein [Albitalea sp.]